VSVPVSGATNVTFSYRFRVSLLLATTAAPFSTRRFRLDHAVLVITWRCHTSAMDTCWFWVTGRLCVFGADVAAIVLETTAFALRATAQERSSRR
jgi:hypothetical protein